MGHLYEMARTGHVQTQPGYIGSQALEAPREEPQPKYLNVQWPALFEPEFLACGSDSPVVMALSRHGRGSLIPLSDAHDVASEPTSFILEGLATHGPLAAASWDPHGLLLMTTAGMTVECPGGGPASHGRWQCRPFAGAKLPISLEGKALAS